MTTACMVKVMEMLLPGKYWAERGGRGGEDLDNARSRSTLGEINGVCYKLES